MFSRPFLIAAAALALLAACASQGGRLEPMGQFFAGENSTAAIGPLGQGIATVLPDPSEPIVVIYNHGTDWGGQFQDCEPGTMPGFLKYWSRKGLGGHPVVVFYLCTQEVEDRFVMGKARSQENEVVLDRLIAAGVPPRNIFVFGHSGGASTALLTAERAPAKFNSAVVSAPGYGFAWLEEEGGDYAWMEVEYDKWRGRLERARDMSALAFVFEGDIYAPPGDALFLGAKEGVAVVTVRDTEGNGILCRDEPEPHFYWWSSCFNRIERKDVEAFVLERLEHRAWLP
ncbi:MAG: hypothetical protein O3B22_00760 [Proteobacteria bacterium]|nr:hypothetical protein [Pseudomonadota bacterium]MDA0952951.1 hypothetical protein [Pseudomonadota bacterium]